MLNVVTALFGANAIVNNSEGSNCLLVGIPAVKKRNEDTWMKGSYRERYEACEKLRQKVFEGKERNQSSVYQ